MNPDKIVALLIKTLPVRMQDILCRRFGLKNKKMQTLQEIGDSYGLTRERIRQLEAKAFLNLQGNKKLLKPVLADLKKVFNQRKQIISQEELLKKIEPYQSSCYFILRLADDFYRFYEDTQFKCHWTTDTKISTQAKTSIDLLIQYLEEKKEPISRTEVFQYTHKPYLEISKLVAQNVFGQFGLINWPEITPRGVKDKAYIILKREQKPVHFRKITELINQINFSDSRKAYVNTVHNELIKDPRFSLEGRGVYGLSNNI